MLIFLYNLQYFLISEVFRVRTFKINKKLFEWDTLLCKNILITYVNKLDYAYL